MNLYWGPIDKTYEELLNVKSGFETLEQATRWVQRHVPKHDRSEVDPMLFAELVLSRQQVRKFHYRYLCGVSKRQYRALFLLSASPRETQDRIVKGWINALHCANLDSPSGFNLTREERLRRVRTWDHYRDLVNTAMRFYSHAGYFWPGKIVEGNHDELV